MKSYIKLITTSLFISIIAIACNTEETVSEESEIISTNLNAEYGAHSFLPLTFDWRYGSYHCYNGGGFCFNSFGGDGNDNNNNIIIYEFNNNINNDKINSEIKHHINQAMIGNEDPDNGVTVFQLEDNRLRMIFSRSLEEDSFIVEENEELHSSIARSLGRERIIIPAGEYQVDRTNFEHGETYIELQN